MPRSERQYCSFNQDTGLKRATQGLSRASDWIILNKWKSMDDISAVRDVDLSLLRFLVGSRRFARIGRKRWVLGPWEAILK